MKTWVSGTAKVVEIGDGHPTRLIGERINPTGKPKLAEAIRSRDFDFIRAMAREQILAGADVLDVNVGKVGGDVALLSLVAKAIQEEFDIPLSLDSDNPAAVEEALKHIHGKPIVNSVTGQEASLEKILPLVKEYGAAVIALTIDDAGIPPDSERRLAIAQKIVDRAMKFGIYPQDIVIDCLALTVSTQNSGSTATLDAVRKVRTSLGLNQTLGASNISFGLPDRDVINNAFLAIAIEAGVTCPTVNVGKVRQTVLATDLLLGCDRYAQRYIKDYRRRLAAMKPLKQ